ncbi:3-oxoacyl-[acyl-carrier-protein] synthase III C-terminal domain-containing protein [Mycolicibacterium hippocampi]|jgi:3-oxoacyl-[acyl-carrier-protein] synthase-3|uniref:3-oxoacyl-[acyl-carrier-protein] synthase, KASIII n=1 Tax=Mycolicibacterium hippocampi TaxID=659824 RepID=A0A850PHT7_9MYCO|nr:3-oxoacyl-[acyl-carrier-protein] synthase III C-terminal domain-containing protein [Mycolicibacterium hippocampi]NVN48327.1 3-oxoacyl-[acyl-carrier-protein] synthase, KASIII [Mycolicibacterium hippocampi]
MGTVVERVEVIRGNWRTRHSALHLAVAVAKTCLHHDSRNADEVDLLINAGIYRDHNLAEPALAALIQEDIGANTEVPHGHGHGTFSFDVANGACGVLTALQIIDGFLRSRTINCALVVASDADPGHGRSEGFPFSPAGAAMLCDWRDDDLGLSRVHWMNMPDDGENFRATVGLHDSHNVLRFSASTDRDEHFASAGAEVVRRCLHEANLTMSDIDIIVAAPPRAGYRAALARRLAVPVERIVVAHDERMHTAALPWALYDVSDQLPPGSRILLVATGAGITAGAALYRTTQPRSRT